MFSIRFTFISLWYRLEIYAICYTDGEKLLLHPADIWNAVDFKILIEIKKKPVLLKRQQAPGITAEALKK